MVQGRPIYIQHLGQVNIKKIYDITTEERMLKFHVQEYERCIQYIMPACSKVAGRHIEQTFAILDVKGMVVAVAQMVAEALFGGTLCSAGVAIYHMGCPSHIWLHCCAL